MNTLLAATLAYLVQVFDGNLGCAIVALSLGLRVALLPVSIRLARRARRAQEKLRAMQPELSVLEKRWAGQPARRAEALAAVYRKFNYSPVDGPALLGGFLQWPVFAMVYRAIRGAVAAGGRFLWIRNLASPDAGLTLLILAVSGLAVYWAPAASETVRAGLIFVQLAITGLIVWKLAAGVGLYWLSSSAVGLVQSLWLRWRDPQAAG